MLLRKKNKKIFFGQLGFRCEYVKLSSGSKASVGSNNNNIFNGNVSISVVCVRIF